MNKLKTRVCCKVELRGKHNAQTHLQTSPPSFYRAQGLQVFKAMEKMSESYAANYPDMAAAWPSDGSALWDDKLLAAAWMLLATGDPHYRCASCLLGTQQC